MASDVDYSEIIRRVMSGQAEFEGMTIANTGSHKFKGSDGKAYWATPIYDGQRWVGHPESGGYMEHGPLKSFRITEALADDGKGTNVYGGGASAQYKNSPYVEVDPSGKVLGSNNWGGHMGTGGITDAAALITAAAMTMGAGAAVAGAGAAGAGAAGGSAGTGATVMTAAETAAANSAFAQSLSPYLASGTSATAGAGVFNAAMDSQAANAAIQAGGGNALAGYTAAGAPSVAGGAGGGFMDILKSGASSLFGGGTGGGGWTSLIGPALSLVGGAYSAHQADNAADAQIAALNGGIDESRRQFDTVRELLRPYVEAGTGALGAYRNLSGLGGVDAQAAEIAALKAGPQFGSLVGTGEEAILANASATGGLRGGNTQNSLADFRTNVLSGLIDKQLGRYGGVMTLGQNSAAGTGTAALQTGQQVAGLMQQQGAAEAGGILAGTRAINGALGGVGGFATGYGGMPGYGTPGFGTGVIPGNQPARAF